MLQQEKRGDLRLVRQDIDSSFLFQWGGRGGRAATTTTRRVGMLPSILHASSESRKFSNLVNNG